MLAVLHFPLMFSKSWLNRAQTTCIKARLHVVIIRSACCHVMRLSITLKKASPFIIHYSTELLPLSDLSCRLYDTSTKTPHKTTLVLWPSLCFLYWRLCVSHTNFKYQAYVWPCFILGAFLIFWRNAACKKKINYILYTTVWPFLSGAVPSRTICVWYYYQIGRSPRKGAEDDHETMRIMPIGAGNEVGRSCVILKYMGKTIMLDCGIHPVWCTVIDYYLS